MVSDRQRARWPSCRQKTSLRGSQAIRLHHRNEDSVNANTRCYGFLKTLQEHEVPADSILTLDGNYRFSGGYDAAMMPLADFGATCLFCCNDLMALGAIDRFRELGSAIPADISIIGYDNIVKRFGCLCALPRWNRMSPNSLRRVGNAVRHIQHHDPAELRRGERFAAARTTVGRGRHRRAGAGSSADSRLPIRLST